MRKRGLCCYSDFLLIYVSVLYRQNRPLVQQAYRFFEDYLLEYYGDDKENSQLQVIFVRARQILQSLLKLDPDVVVDICKVESQELENAIEPIIEEGPEFCEESLATVCVFSKSGCDILTPLCDELTSDESELKEFLESLPDSHKDLCDAVSVVLPSSDSAADFENTVKSLLTLLEQVQGAIDRFEDSVKGFARSFQHLDVNATFYLNNSIKLMDHLHTNLVFSLKEPEDYLLSTNLTVQRFEDFSGLCHNYAKDGEIRVISYNDNAAIYSDIVKLQATRDLILKQIEEYDQCVSDLKEGRLEWAIFAIALVTLSMSIVTAISKLFRYHSKTTQQYFNLEPKEDEIIGPVCQNIMDITQMLLTIVSSALVVAMLKLQLEEDSGKNRALLEGVFYAYTILFAAQASKQIGCMFVRHKLCDKPFANGQTNQASDPTSQSNTPPAPENSAAPGNGTAQKRNASMSRSSGSSSTEPNNTKPDGSTLAKS